MSTGKKEKAAKPSKGKKGTKTPVNAPINPVKPKSKHAPKNPRNRYTAPRWTPHLKAKLVAHLKSCTEPQRIGKIAVFLDVSRETLYQWAQEHRDLAGILAKESTKRSEHETDEAIAGRLTFPLYKFLAECTHGALTEFQRQTLELKRQEIASQNATLTREAPPVIQMNFEVLPPSNITIEQLQEGI